MHAKKKHLYEIMKVYEWVQEEKIYIYPFMLQL